QRDQEVKSHEQAHITAGGSHVVGGASFSYQKGPDGQQYAVGGEVQISTGAVPGDPAATLEKASTVMRSALAPSNPSAQDMAVAASAAQTIATARLELAQQQSATTEQVGEGRLRSQQSALATEYALHGQGLAAERNRTETAINQFV
ncbi:MAG TPA: catalase, partial [Gammaproteobacteria bacterium]|nr:catalase [Gammaproteobacteria bacterium]